MQQYRVVQQLTILYLLFIVSQSVWGHGNNVLVVVPAIISNLLKYLVILVIFGPIWKREKFL